MAEVPDFCYACCRQSAVAKSFDAEEQPLSGAVTTEVECAAESATLEPKLDPLEKYMAIVQQKREKEKQVH